MGSRGSSGPLDVETCVRQISESTQFTIEGRRALLWTGRVVEAYERFALDIATNLRSAVEIHLYGARRIRKLSIQNVSIHGIPSVGRNFFDKIPLIRSRPYRSSYYWEAATFMAGAVRSLTKEGTAPTKVGAVPFRTPRTIETQPRRTNRSNPLVRRLLCTTWRARVSLEEPSRPLPILVHDVQPTKADEHLISRAIGRSRDSRSLSKHSQLVGEPIEWGSHFGG